MLLATATLALIAAVGLVAAGLHGCRADDHPLCRRCGYDLTGSPGGRCPECGADLGRPRATRGGHRVRIRRLVIAGTGLALPAVALLGTRALTAARQLTDPANQPVWWLRHKLNSNPADRDAAVSELDTRLAAEQLTAAQVTSIADQILDMQATATPWNGLLGQFVEEAHGEGQLDPGRWARYARQSFPVTLVVRPTVRQGDTIPVEVALDLKRAEFSPF